MAGEVAGLLIERVTIERRTEERDALGGSAAAWTQEAEVWAGVAPDRRAAETAGGALRGERRWAVTLRRRSGLGLDCGLLWKGRVLGVRLVEDDSLVGDVMMLRCEEEPCSSG